MLLASTVCLTCKISTEPSQPNIAELHETFKMDVALLVIANRQDVISAAPLRTGTSLSRLSVHILVYFPGCSSG